MCKDRKLVEENKKLLDLVFQQADALTQGEKLIIDLLDSAHKLNMLEEQFKIYKEIEDKIFEAFNYKEERSKFTVNLQLKDYWVLNLNKDNRGKITYSPKPITLEIIKNSKEIYTAKLYAPLYFDRCVWKTDTHTMVLVENVRLAIFTNELRCRDAQLVVACHGIYF